MMDWHEYIHSDPNILVGKPVIKGTRIAVEFLLDLYGAGWTEAQILESYPHLTSAALRAVHAYAAESVRVAWSVRWDPALEVPVYCRVEVAPRLRNKSAAIISSRDAALPQE